MAGGVVYLAVVLDWFSRRVLSWRLLTMETSIYVAALEHALALYGKPEIFNKDRGSQCNAFLVVIDVSKLRNDVLIQTLDKTRRWRPVVRSTKLEHDRFVGLLLGSPSLPALRRRGTTTDLLRNTRIKCA